MITVNTTKTAKESAQQSNVTIDSFKIKELSKKLSLEAQEELKDAKDVFSEHGSMAESIVLKSLLDFEKTITNGRYFNGKSIVSDKALINKAFKHCADAAVSQYQNEYPGLTMTMTRAKAFYDLNELDPESSSDFLLIRFDVACKDSNGKFFESILIAESSIYYPDPKEFFHFRGLHGEFYPESYFERIQSYIAKR